MCSNMKLFSLWSDFCHRLYKYCGGGPRIVQICWEDGHKTCPWARDYRVGRTHPVKYILIFSFDDWDWCLIAGCGLWCEMLRTENCDNLMFHTSIYGSPVRPVILIANEINEIICSFKWLKSWTGFKESLWFSPSNKKDINLL